jgi:hemerythrin-like domain-containing protein
MMGIVHSALRRDLVRTRLVLQSEPPPERLRRVAISAHLRWMMDFLHHHHQGEDEGLYPLVVSKNPGAAGLVSEMDAEHTAIAPAINALESAAAEYGADSPGSRERVLEALEAMSVVLLPHLQREEAEMMPVVAASISAHDWATWDHATNIKPKGPGQLGMEGHWLIDGADATDRARVVGLVPPVPRFILLHGFAGIYRRRATRLWGGSPAASVPSLTLALAPQWSS